MVVNIIVSCLFDAYTLKKINTAYCEYSSLKCKLLAVGMGYNFMKVNHINSLEEPYDFDSLMYYGRTFFSKNGRPTLFPRKKGVRLSLLLY